jgi:hypothetical protein
MSIRHTRTQMLRGVLPELALKGEGQHKLESLNAQRIKGSTAELKEDLRVLVPDRPMQLLAYTISIPDGCAQQMPLTPTRGLDAGCVGV